ncbi:hypothetical protein K0U07_01850 [bacterium]|nr:hypothetical protein [bacterium]
MPIDPLGPSGDGFSIDDASHIPVSKFQKKLENKKLLADAQKALGVAQKASESLKRRLDPKQTKQMTLQGRVRKLREGLGKQDTVLSNVKQFFKVQIAKIRLHHLSKKLGAEERKEGKLTDKIAEYEDQIAKIKMELKDLE